jgi:heavy metal sensor kinase
VQVQAESLAWEQARAWAFIVDLHGTVLDHAGAPSGPGPVRAALLRAQHGWSGWVSLAGNLRAYTGQERDDAGHRFIVQVISSRAGADRTVARVLLAMLLAAPVFLLVSGASGLLLAARGLAPVDRITRTARRIGMGDLHERLGAPAREDEVGRLSRTFDWMLDRLDETLRRQRQFTADASHELRTPLTILQGEVDLALVRPRAPEEYRAALQVVQGQVAHMQGLVDDLLTLARANSGRLDLAHELLPLHEVIGQAAAQSQALFGAKGLTFDVVLDGECFVVGDSARLTQLILNLLGNAARYTDRGGVRLRLERQGDRAVCSVQDTGIGIPADQLAMIFERFYRVDTARTRGQGGTGLGLAIARWIAQAHGGTIEVESRVGVGTTFRCILPLAPPDTQRAWGAAARDASDEP